MHLINKFSELSAMLYKIKTGNNYIITKYYFIYLNNEKYLIFLIIYIKSRGVFSIFV